jgi:hypothetical protein
LRVRLGGGYGGYRYDSFDPLTGVASRFDADVTTADVLIGYLWRLDPLIAKVFVGAAAIDHQIHPYDQLNEANGEDFGAKVVAELWLNLGSTGYASLDLAWSQAHDTRSARGRIGYRLLPTVSIGLEGGVNLDSQAEYKMNREQPSHRTETWDYVRAGVFARYEWYGGEISASAGLSGDMREHKTGYGTINWITQF